MTHETKAKELKAAAVALVAGLGVVGASWGASALVGPHGSLEKAHQGAMRSPTAPTQVADASLVKTGRGLYGQACASCHGRDAKGGGGANLHGLGDPDNKVALVIKNGIKGKMPAFGSRYSTAQQQALVAYVQSLSK